MSTVNNSIPSRLGLPVHRDAYYGGRWQKQKNARYIDTMNPGTGESLCEVADCDETDVDSAVASAKVGFNEWRRVLPLERARILRRVAVILREHAGELAMIDAANCGNPVRELLGDANIAAAQMEFFAGLVTEMKGSSIPMGPGAVNYSVREPRGVVGRIVPFNHPFMFCAGKAAAPLAAGNAVIIKPPEQAPLSSLRLAELCDGLFPPGVFNVVPGGKRAGARLASHPDVAMIGLVGSVPTGIAVMKAAADTVKPVLLELGGKNALIAYPDSDPDEVASALVSGMNFSWCGQSCGSTSRAFVHEKIYSAVLDRLAMRVQHYKPGIPTDPNTSMGAIVSKIQYDNIMKYIGSAVNEGARLLCGGGRPADQFLKNGLFIEPTIFVDVTSNMTIAREEIFGPVLAVLKWSNEADMLEQVNEARLGLTCSIWTNDVSSAHRAASMVEAGYIWINETSKHFIGAAFGGFKQSGIGREECLEELLAFTQEKNIHIRFK